MKKIEKILKLLDDDIKSENLGLTCIKYINNVIFML